jgi:hypothetical protein
VVSPALVDGRRVDVAGADRLSVWLPADWEIVEGQMYDLLALGPPEEPYRANLSIAHVTLDAGPASLEDVARATATVQSSTLETFLEYERRTTELAGRKAIQREYAWVQGATGLVLYQLEVLAQASQPMRLLEVHATSAAPAYFRYAALLRRMIESIEPLVSPG